MNCANIILSIGGAIILIFTLVKIADIPKSQDEEG